MRIKLGKLKIEITYGLSNMKVSIALFIKRPEHIGNLADGDIVAVMPAGHPWSDTERKHFLIAEVDLPMTFEEARKLEYPLFENDDVGKREDKDGIPIPAPAMVSKRKFKLLLTDIPGIDLDQARDPVKEYQPLKGITLSSDLIHDKFMGAKADLTKLKN